MLDFKKIKYAYGQHRRDAKKRCILFLLTYEEWLKIWVDSGNLHKRGRKIGQYVMARFKDEGPYKVGNVKIILCEDNHKEAAAKMIGIPKSEEAKRNLSKACLGRTLSEETKKKIGDAHRGKPMGPMSEETKKKLSIAKTGKPGHPLSAYAKACMQAGKRAYWEKKRAGCY